MFVLGLVLGLLAAAAVAFALWTVIHRELLPSAGNYRSRAAIHDIERQTIHAMLAAELAAQQAAQSEERRP